MNLMEIIKRNKRIVFGFCMFGIVMSLVAGYLLYNKSTLINDKVIRFHVLANSDSNLDQEVKIKVKDKVIEYVQPLLKNSKTLKESRGILVENKDKIIGVANRILEENGQTYTASAEIGRFDFPVKSYGEVVFPSGEYEAFRIKLGEAEGKNWWCVMFPPLCFIDTKNAISETKVEKELERVMSKEEINSISQKEEVKEEVGVKKENKVKEEKKVSKSNTRNEKKEVDKTSNNKSEKSGKKISKEVKKNKEVKNLKQNEGVKKKGKVEVSEKSQEANKNDEPTMQKKEVIKDIKEQEKPKMKLKIVEIFQGLFG